VPESGVWRSAGGGMLVALADAERLAGAFGVVA